MGPVTRGALFKIQGNKMNNLKKTALTLLLISLPLGMFAWGIKLPSLDDVIHVVEKGAEDIIHTVEEDAKAIENKVKDDLDKAGEVVREAADKVGQTLNLDFLKDDTVKQIIKMILALDYKKGLAIIKNLSAQVADDPYYNKQATADFSSSLPFLEKQFLKARDTHTAKALAKALSLNENILRDKNVRIAVGFSGGGYRSISWGSGAMKALDELGIMDATTYLGGVSGGSWLLSLWLMFGQNINTLLETLKVNLSRKFFESLRPIDVLEISLAYLLNGQKVGPIELYGIGLASPMLNNNYKNRLSNFQGPILSGKRPLPFITASGADDPINTLFAASPISTRITSFDPINKKYLYTTVPAWSAGRSWYQGKSNKGLSTTLSTVIATSGSAFTDTINKMISGNNQHFIKILGQELFDKIYTKLEPSSIGKFRFLPYQFPNPGYGVKNQAFSNKKRVKLTDSGASRNDSYMESFLDPKRNVKIIFFIEAGDDGEGKFEIEYDHLKDMINAKVPGYTKELPKISDEANEANDPNIKILQNKDYLIVLMRFSDQDDFTNSESLNIDYKGEKINDMLRIQDASYQRIMNRSSDIKKAITDFIIPPQKEEA
jgi:hypothetical protein